MSENRNKGSAIYTVILFILFGLFCYKCSAPSPNEKEEYLEKNAFNYTVKYEEDRLEEYLKEHTSLIDSQLEEREQMGYKNGYSEGYSQGEYEGYKTGYLEGYEDCEYGIDGRDNL